MAWPPTLSSSGAASKHRPHVAIKLWDTRAQATTYSIVLHGTHHRPWTIVPTPDYTRALAFVDHSPVFGGRG